MERLEHALDFVFSKDILAQELQSSVLCPQLRLRSAAIVGRAVQRLFAGSGNPFLNGAASTIKRVADDAGRGMASLVVAELEKLIAMPKIEPGV